MTKQLFTCSYWVDFPSSEYGGLAIIRAEDIGSAERTIRAKAAEEPEYAHLCIDEAIGSLKFIGWSEGEDGVVEVFSP